MTAKRLVVVVLAILLVLCSCGGPGTVTLSSVTIQSSSTSMAAGKNVQMNALGRYSDTTVTLLTNVSWSSSNTAVATVNASGMVTGMSAGTANITANMNGVSSSMTVTVMAPILQSLSISPTNASVVQGLSLAFTATGTMSDGSAASASTLANVAWTSSNATFATVPSAPAASVSAQGVAPGSVTITASIGTVTISTGLDVVAPSVTQVVVTPESYQLDLGESYQCTATAYYNNNTTTNVTSQATWQSADATKVEVNHGGTTGLVYGVASSAGTGITVTAAFGGKTGSASVFVKAPPPPTAAGFLYPFGDYASISTFSVNEAGVLGNLSRVSFLDEGQEGTSMVGGAGKLYLASRRGLPSKLKSFAVNQTNGSVATGSTFDFDTNIPNLAVHPNGKFVYATTYGENYEYYIQKLAVDPVTGQFTAGSSIAATILDTYPDGGERMIFNPAGTVLYLTTRSRDPNDPYGYSVHHLRSYSVDSITGALTPLQDLTNPKRLLYSMTFDTTGKFLYIPAFEYETYYDTIEIYAVAADGTITSSTSFPNGRYHPPDKVRSVNGKLVISWTENGAGVYFYDIDQSTGVPTLIASYTDRGFADLTFSPDGNFMYVIGNELFNWYSAMQTYRIDLTAGSVTLVGSATIYDVGVYRSLVFVPLQPE